MPTISNMSALLFLVATWHPVALPEGAMEIEMPTEPTFYQRRLDGGLMNLYVSDTSDGQFKAGFAHFTPNLEQQLTYFRSHGSADAVSDLVTKALTVTVNAFAKGANMKVENPQCVVSQGLPAEFATVRSSDKVLKLHVYLGVKGYYVVSAPAQSQNAAHFWDSLKLPNQ